MRKNKIFKYINAVLLCLPFLSVLFGCCYAMFNNNAYLSNDMTSTYYEQGEVLKYKTNEIDNNNYDDMIVGNYYQLSFYYKINNDSSSSAIFGNINKIGGYFSLIDTSYNDIWFIKPFTFNNSEFNRVLMTCNLEQEYNYFYMGSTAIGSSIYTTVNYNGVDCKCITLFVKCLNPIDLYFSIPTDAYLVVSSLPNYIAYESSFVPLNTYTLNNAFHYGICEFNKIGFDKLNFVNWFTNLFVSNTSNLYVVFVNSYLNYMLFVECCIFLPYILLWFVRFCESIIDKFLGGAK